MHGKNCEVKSEVCRRHRFHWGLCFAQCPTLDGPLLELLTDLWKNSSKDQEKVGEGCLAGEGGVHLGLAPDGAGLHRCGEQLLPRPRPTLLPVAMCCDCDKDRVIGILGDFLAFPRIFSRCGNSYPDCQCWPCDSDKTGKSLSVWVIGIQAVFNAFWLVLQLWKIEEEVGQQTQSVRLISWLVDKWWLWEVVSTLNFKD